LLCCNPLSVCYVTGIGKNPTQKPHHRPSGFLQKTMPGMLAGGPSEWAADEVTKKIIDGKAPLACYADVYESFCTNEIAIYWNSPLVYTIAKLKLV
jgi:endoglucanase